jgi:hypothetical protein
MHLRSKHQAMHLLPIHMEVLPPYQRALLFQVDTTTQAIPEIKTRSIQIPDMYRTPPMPITSVLQPTRVGPFSPVSLQTTIHTSRIDSQHAQVGTDTDPFRAYATPQAQQTFDPTTYNASARLSPPTQPSSTRPHGSAAEQTTSYYTPQVRAASPPTQSRAYTLGGGGYGDSSVPALQDSRMSDGSSYLPYPGDAGTHSSGSVYSGLTSPTTPRGPRDPAPGMMLSPVEDEYEDSPPMYEDNIVTGGIGTSRPAPSGKR